MTAEPTRELLLARCSADRCDPDTLLADVLVCDPRDGDADDLVVRALARHPLAAVALAPSPAGITAALADGRVLHLRPGRLDGCASPTGVVESVAVSLHAWALAGVDLALLAAHGLPVWCAGHRAERRDPSCGRFAVTAGRWRGTQ